jgi:hypothetical protein
VQDHGQVETAGDLQMSIQHLDLSLHAYDRGAVQATLSDGDRSVGCAGDRISLVLQEFRMRSDRKQPLMGGGL